MVATSVHVSTIVFLSERGSAGESSDLFAKKYINEAVW